MTRCDISQGSIEIAPNIFRCNGQQISAPGSIITISGVTTSNSVKIVDSSAIVLLESVSVQTSNPFSVENSNVLLILTGINQMTGSASYSSVICCRDSSNLTFQAISSGFLTVAGQARVSGIGSGRGDTCDSLRFINGSYTASAGTEGGSGIGTGVAWNINSNVNQIVFDDGSYTAVGNFGAGIGTGLCYLGVGIVGRMLFNNGSYNASGVGINYYVLFPKPLSGQKVENFGGLVKVISSSGKQGEILKEIQKVL
jgi:hypothetical protein